MVYSIFQVELKELRVKSIFNKSHYVAVLAPVKAEVVRKKLSVELRIDSKDIILIFMGKALKDTDTIPEECFMAKRFTFLRWLDQAHIDAYNRRLEEMKRKKKEEYEKVLQLYRQRENGESEDPSKKLKVPQLDMNLDNLLAEGPQSPLGGKMTPSNIPKTHSAMAPVTRAESRSRLRNAQTRQRSSAMDTFDLRSVT